MNRNRQKLKTQWNIHDSRLNFLQALKMKTFDSSLFSTAGKHSNCILTYSRRLKWDPSIPLCSLQQGTSDEEIKVPTLISASAAPHAVFHAVFHHGTNFDCSTRYCASKLDTSSSSTKPFCFWKRKIRKYILPAIWTPGLYHRDTQSR